MDSLRFLGKFGHHVDCVNNVRTVLIIMNIKLPTTSWHGKNSHCSSSSSCETFKWTLRFVGVVTMCFNQSQFGNDFQDGFKFFKEYQNIVMVSHFSVFLYTVLFDYVNTQNGWNWWNLKCSGLNYDTCKIFDIFDSLMLMGIKI